VPGYRVPFGQASPDEETEDFDPGPVLARIVDEDLVPDNGGTAEGSIDTAWGKLAAERRGGEEVHVTMPEAEVTSRQVMVNVAAMKLGVDKALVEETEAAIQAIDVGEPVLVCPLPGEDAVRDAPTQAQVATVPGVEAEIGVAYTVVQTSPYARIVARSWGEGPPMTVLAAAAVHLMLSERFRPTYPRTRVVAELVDEEGEVEITVQAREAGGGPVVERVLVGGPVEALDG